LLLQPSDSICSMARFAPALLVASLRAADAQDLFIPARQLRGSTNASIVVPVEMENASLSLSNVTSLPSLLSEASADLWCTPVDDKCGGQLGPYKWHKKCCGHARCQKLFGSPDGTMKCVEKQPDPHGPDRGCWSSNGVICQYVFGEANRCYSTAAACSRETGKPQGCYEYNGARCKWVVGDRPSKCYTTKRRCEHQNRRLSEASHEDSSVAQSPDSSHSEDAEASSEGPEGLNALGQLRGSANASIAAPVAMENASLSNLTSQPTSLAAAAADLWCTPVDGKCGGQLGPIKWHKKCCGNARCQKLFGSPDGTMKCVRNHNHPPHQCVPHHGECGGPGRQTLPCCAPRLSCRKQFFSEIMKCM